MCQFDLQSDSHLKVQGSSVPNRFVVVRGRMQNQPVLNGQAASLDVNPFATLAWRGQKPNPPLRSFVLLKVVGNERRSRSPTRVAARRTDTSRRPDLTARTPGRARHYHRLHKSTTRQAEQGSARFICAAIA
jgi:hypothetical protein